MSHIVLDTDVWSFVLKRDSRAERYRSHLEGNTPCVSFQTLAELYQWAEMADWGGSRRKRLQEWLGNFQVLGYDNATALIWARIRAERNRRGRPLSAQDAWVAACALRHLCPLDTNNASDYLDIEELDIISEAL